MRLIYAKEKGESVLFIAIGSYVAAMVFSFVLNIFLLYKVEKSGLKRWGATGRLFKYKAD